MSPMSPHVATFAHRGRNAYGNAGAIQYRKSCLPLKRCVSRWATGKETTRIYNKVGENGEAAR